MIYLDNSATTYPKPPQVRAAVAQALAEYGANPGRSAYDMCVRTTEKLYQCRETAARLFHARGPECVVFQAGCTQAVNTVLQGCLDKGDHVVVSDLEHNAVMRPLAALEERGIPYTVAPVSPSDPDATLDAFRQAITPQTKLVVCTHASNVFGLRLPVERLCALVHQYGIKLCVDGAQTAGVVPIHMMESGIDYLCVAGHKGLYGPMGTGLLVLGNPEEKPRPLLFGGTGTNSRSLLQPEDPPERFESGTQNVPGLLGLQAGMAFVLSKGEANLYLEEMKKICYLYDALSSTPGVELYTRRPDIPGFVPVLSFNFKGLPSEAVGERLAKWGIAVRSGLHCAPAAHQKMGTTQGTVRVSPSVFTTKAQLDALVLRLRNQKLWTGLSEMERI